MVFRALEASRSSVVAKKNDTKTLTVFCLTQGNTAGITICPYLTTIAQDYCPCRVLAQRVRDENFAVAEKISIFQEQGSQRIAAKYVKDCRNFAGGRINPLRSPLPGASICAVPLSQPFPMKNYFWNRLSRENPLFPRT